jgi:type II secretory pathway pseudopilin PulG
VKRADGFSIKETFIAIAILGVLLTMVVWSFQTNIQQRDAIRAFKHMQLVHLTIQQMRLDNLTNGGPIRWTSSNETPLPYGQWTNLIVAGKYLSQEQLEDHLQLRSAKNAIIPLAVTESDPDNTVILVTTTWPGQATAKSSGLRSGNFGYFRKDGSGMPPGAPTSDTNSVGAGGKFNFQPLQ